VRFCFQLYDVTQVLSLSVACVKSQLILLIFRFESDFGPGRDCQEHVVKTESKNDQNEKRNEHQLLEAERKGEKEQKCTKRKNSVPKIFINFTLSAAAAAVAAVKRSWSKNEEEECDVTKQESEYTKNGAQWE